MVPGLSNGSKSWKAITGRKIDRPQFLELMSYAYTIGAWRSGIAGVAK